MKAEELMIGNFVSYKGKSHKVTGITPPYVDIIESDGRGFIEVHEEEIEPIEITSKILIKNGFRQVFIDNTYYHKYEKENLYITCIQHKSDCKYRITIETKYERLCWVNIQYIHQLQNACNLVDKELEIEL